MRPELAGALAVAAALVLFSPSDAGVPANGAPSNGAGSNGLSVNRADAHKPPRWVHCKPPFRPRWISLPTGKPGWKCVAVIKPLH
jgi:hypothetical protein